MGKYRKLPVVIDAIQWTGWNIEDIQAMFVETVSIIEGPDTLMIDTLEGVVTASLGDYIIKGVNGEAYPCKPGIFEKTYEIVP